MSIQYAGPHEKVELDVKERAAFARIVGGLRSPRASHISLTRYASRQISRIGSR